MNLLEVKNISKTYGNGETAVKALKDVSFSVPKGEYVAIVGESGSGKSTLLNMIGALDTPTSGKVLIDGKDIFAMNDRKLTVFRRRNIGFIFQAFNLIPELTVEQNIIFPLLLDYQKLSLMNEKQSLSHFKGRSLCWKASRRCFHRRRKNSAKKKLSAAFLRCSANMGTGFPNHSQHCCPGLLMV